MRNMAKLTFIDYSSYDKPCISVIEKGNKEYVIRHYTFKLRNNLN
jgi:hypothetical protein